MKKHILVISQYFYPEQFRINDIATEWVNRGYEVTVVTGIPNYPKGQFFDGYGLFRKRREEYNGIKIVRLPIIPRGKRSITLALNYVSFVVSGFFWRFFTRINADYVFMFEVSPMTQALLGVWYKKRKKVPCYLYVQDLWPENVQLMTGISNKHIINSIGRMVDYIYKHCDKLFVTSKSFVNAIMDRGVPQEKIDFWPQYAEDFYKPVNREDITIDEISMDDKLNVVYAGNIGKFQQLDILIEIGKEVEKLSYGDKLRINIIGGGRYKNQLIKNVDTNKLGYMFNFIDRKPAEDIPQYMSACDIAYLSLKNDPISNMTIPAKVQSYLACGMAIVAIAEGETENVINESGAGLCFKHGQTEDIAKALTEIIENNCENLSKWQENAIKYHKEHFVKSDLMDYMDKYFEM